MDAATNLPDFENWTALPRARSAMAAGVGQLRDGSNIHAWWIVEGRNRHEFSIRRERGLIGPVARGLARFEQFIFRLHSSKRCVFAGYQQQLALAAATSL